MYIYTYSAIYLFNKVFSDVKLSIRVKHLGKTNAHSQKHKIVFKSHKSHLLSVTMRKTCILPTDSVGILSLFAAIIELHMTQ